MSDPTSDPSLLASLAGKIADWVWLCFVAVFGWIWKMDRDVSSMKSKSVDRDKKLDKTVAKTTELGEKFAAMDAKFDGVYTLVKDIKQDIRALRKD